MVLGVIERSENQKPTLLDNKGNYLRREVSLKSVERVGVKQKKLAFSYLVF
jgi:hypothetical protein